MKAVNSSTIVYKYACLDTFNILYIMLKINFYKTSIGNHLVNLSLNKHITFN
jgi:hypothetical protein